MSTGSNVRFMPTLCVCLRPVLPTSTTRATIDPLQASRERGDAERMMITGSIVVIGRCKTDLTQGRGGGAL